MPLTAPGNTSQINLELTSLLASVSYQGHNHISPPTCAAFLQRILMSGWNTATLQPAARPWLNYEQQVVSVSHSRCDSGVLATNHGAAAVTSRPKSTRWSFAASPPGYRGMVCSWPSLVPDQTAQI